MERVQNIRNVQHHVRVRQVERNRDHRADQQTGVLTKRGERTRVERVIQRLQSTLQSLPLLDRQLGISRLFTQQITKPTRCFVVARLKPPVTLRRPHRNAVVRLHWHLLAQCVEHHSQRITRRTIQTLPNRRSDFKLIQRSIRRSMIEHVTAPARQVVTLENFHLVPVLGQQRPARQTSDAASDHHDVVFLIRIVQHRRRGRVRRHRVGVFAARARPRHRYPSPPRASLARCARRLSSARTVTTRESDVHTARDRASHRGGGHARRPRRRHDTSRPRARGARAKHRPVVRSRRQRARRREVRRVDILRACSRARATSRASSSGAARRRSVVAAVVGPYLFCLIRLYWIGM